MTALVCARNLIPPKPQLLMPPLTPTGIHPAPDSQAHLADPAHLRTSLRAGGRGPLDTHTCSPEGAQGTGGKGDYTGLEHTQQCPLGARGH